MIPSLVGFHLSAYHYLVYRARPLALPHTYYIRMQSTLRGVLGLGVTLLVVAAAMATINGVVRGWSAKQLAKNPNDPNAAALVMLF